MKTSAALLKQWALWTLASTSGLTIGMLMTLLPIVAYGAATEARFSLLPLGILVAPIGGGIIALSQWLVLRRVGVRFISWTTVTASAWTLTTLAFLLVPYGQDLHSVAAFAILCGFVLGTAQWLVLRATLKAASWWIPASILGAGFAAYSALFVARSLPASEAVVLLILNVGYSAITGVTLALLGAETPRRPAHVASLVSANLVLFLATATLLWSSLSQQHLALQFAGEGYCCTFPTTVAISGDSATLAVGFADGRVQVWDATRKSELCEYRASASGGPDITDYVESVALSADGAFVASGARDGALQVWRVVPCENVVSLNADSEVHTIALSRDASLVASASEDSRPVQLRAVRDGTLMGEYSTPTCCVGVSSLTFDSDGSSLAIGLGEGGIALWDGKDARILRSSNEDTQPVVAIAVAPDATAIASASADGTVRLWDIPSLQQIREVDVTSPAWVGELAFSPDLAILAVASSDNRDSAISLVDISSGKTLRTLRGHRSGILGLAFSHDGRSLASVSWDNSVRIWQIK